MIVKTPIQIRFNDVDMAGHVHNGVYLNYFEQGRMDFFYKLTQGEWDWKKYSLILARNEIDYRNPLYLHDEAWVETWFESKGNKSLTLCYAVRRKSKEGEDKLVAEGKSILVCFDYTQGKTIPIPEKWESRLVAPE